MKIKTFILSIVLSFGLFINLTAQIVSSAQVPSDTLEIGQEFGLTFSIYSPEPGLVEEIDLRSLFKMENLVRQDTSIPAEVIDLEISDYGNWPVNQEKAYPKADDWTKNNKGYSLNYFLKAISWDWGIYQVDGLEAKLDSNYQLNFAQSKYIIVKPPNQYQTRDTTSIIADIKPIIDEPLKAEDFYPIAYGLLALLLFFGLFKWYQKSQNKAEQIVEVEPEIIRPAHEIANEKLSLLKSKELWQQGEIKAYQSELTFIIREYLENRYDIKALESTTDQILKGLKSVDFDQTHKDDVRDILTMADLVKFAKAKPGESIHESFMTKAIDLVYKTKQEIIENHD